MSQAKKSVKSGSSKPSQSAGVVEIAFKSMVTLMRPHQWVKNLFVFLPVFFSGAMGNADSVLAAAAAFGVFSLAASSIYCFNDIRDAPRDRQHPKKRSRPVASGVVSPAAAYALMATLLAAAAALAFATFAGEPHKLGEVLGIAALYYVMNLLYCLWLKNIAIIDVFVIALGFVLRVVMGGAAAGIWISEWIVLMTFLLALFLAFAKRRDDVLMYQETGVAMRKNVNRYNLEFMNQAISIIMAVTMVCYIMYTVSDEVTSRMGSRRLYLTSLWVLLGLMRYLQLTIVDARSGSPTKVLLKDRFVQAAVAGWVMTFAVILYL